MKPNIKTVPNQKIVKVAKQKCDKAHLYATINLEAMESAAVALKAGAFKLWVYFAKNQNNYEFALSSAEIAESFGIKKDQYDTAVKELITKGYLVLEKGNKYTFNEIAVVGKNHNEEIENSVIGKNHNDVIGKNHNELQEKTTTPLQEKTIRNITPITNNTLDITEGVFSPNGENAIESQKQKGETAGNPIDKNLEWFRTNYNHHEWKVYSEVMRVYQHIPSKLYYRVRGL